MTASSSTTLSAPGGSGLVWMSDVARPSPCPLGRARRRWRWRERNGRRVSPLRSTAATQRIARGTTTRRRHTIAARPSADRLSRLQAAVIEEGRDLVQLRLAQLGILEPYTTTAEFVRHTAKIWLAQGLVDDASGRAFYVFNTHFDHVSQPSRERSARLIAERGLEARNLLLDAAAVRLDPDLDIIVNDTFDRDQYFHSARLQAHIPPLSARHPES